jgi:hypothetical protein
MNLSFRYGNSLLVDKKPLWADVHPGPESQEVLRVGVEDIQTIIAVGQTALAEALSKYPSLFLVGLRRDEDICYASPSPYTAEGYAKTTGVTIDMAEVDPVFHDYWRAVENNGVNQAIVRAGADATWLMLARRD